MRDQDKEIARKAELQIEQAVAQQVVEAAPGLLAGLIGWIKRKLGGKLRSDLPSAGHGGDDKES